MIKTILVNILSHIMQTMSFNEVIIFKNVPWMFKPLSFIFLCFWHLSSCMLCFWQIFQLLFFWTSRLLCLWHVVFLKFALERRTRTLLENELLHYYVVGYELRMSSCCYHFQMVISYVYFVHGSYSPRLVPKELGQKII